LTRRAASPTCHPYPYRTPTPLEIRHRRQTGGYYFSSKSKAKAPPAVRDVEIRSATSAPPPPPGAQELPPGWSVQTDPSNGRVYYYSSVTGETSWTRPGEGKV